MENVITQQNRASRNKGRLAFEIGYKRIVENTAERHAAAKKRNKAERRLGRAIAQSY